MSRPFSTRTGLVTIRDFDRGVIETLGAAVDPNEQTYYIQIPGVAVLFPQGIPVVFNKPEVVFVDHRLPAILITRGDPTPANNRWQSLEHLEYWMGIGTPEIVNGVTGYPSYETKPQAWPHDIDYTIACYARYESDAQAMLRKMMRRFKPYSVVFVKDSLGDVRSYTGFRDAVSDLSETLDVADRVKAYAITVRVEAELDLYDPQTLTFTVSGFDNTSRRLV